VIRLITDTAAGFATAVLAKDGELLGTVSARGSVLSLLHANIEQVLENSNLELTDIDEVQVVVGPGSWTGLHVSVTSAKTLAQFLGVPIVELSLLDAFGCTHTASDLRVLAMLDAKRGSVYSACYLPGAERPSVIAEPAKRLLKEAVESSWDGTNALVLMGAPAVQEAVAALLPAGVARRTQVAYPSPEAFVALAQARTESRVTGDARFDVVPDYMQDDFTIMPSSQRLR
jgi:tRNA threonylcarbamoyl adenosine modification protein YeaZ